MADKNLNEYFSSNPVVLPGGGDDGGGGDTQYLNDLLDTLITNPLPNEVLSYNGTVWVDKQLSYNDLTDIPTSITNLGDLNDVDIITPNNRESLVFNGVSWVNADVVATSNIDMLSNVNAGSTPGDILVYDGINWASVELDYSNIPNTPTLPGNSDFTFIGLSDTSSLSRPNAYLRWNSSGTAVEYVDNIEIDATAVTGLADVATSGDYNDLSNAPFIPTNLYDLSDVDAPSVSVPNENDVLKYSQTTGWTAVQMTVESNEITDDDGDTYVSVTNEDDTVVVQAGPDGGEIKLFTTDNKKVYVYDQIGGEGNLSSFGPLNITESSNTHTIRLDSTGVLINEIKYPNVDGFSGQVLTTGGNGSLSFTSIAVSTLQDTTINSPAVGEVLTWDGSKWINNPQTGGGSGAQRLDELLDTNISLPASNDLLVYNLSTSAWENGKIGILDLQDTPSVGVPNAYLKWNSTGTVLELSLLSQVATTGDYNDLTNIPTEYTPSDHTHEVADITDMPDIPSSLDDMTDVDLATNAPSLNDVLSFNGSEWVPAEVAAGTGPVAMDDLTDVNSASATDGQVLSWNNALSEWSPTNVTGGGGASTLNELNDVTIGITQDKQVLKFNFGTSQWDNAFIGMSDLTDVITTSTAVGDVLRYSGSSWISEKLSYNDLIEAPSLASVALSGDYNDLANKPALDGLSDVNAPTPTDGQVLTWNGTEGEWTNSTVSSGGDGEVNTASNIGAGEGVFAQKTSEDLEFKSLVAGTNVTLSSNGTEITINSTASGGVSDFESLTDTPSSYVGNDGKYLTVDETGNAVVFTDLPNIPSSTSELSNDAGFLTDAPSNGNQYVRLNGNWAPSAPPNASGLNLGVGENVYASSADSVLSFKSLVAGDNITLSSDGNEITINSTAIGGEGEVNTASNVGAGEGVFTRKNGEDLELKSLVAGNDITITSTPTEITINSTASGGGSADSNVEWARVNYNAFGTILNITETTPNVSVASIEQAQWINFVFANRTTPPIAINFYGYTDLGSLGWGYKMVQPFIDTNFHTLLTGGTAGNPGDLLTNMTTSSLRLQTRAQETASDNGEHAYVFFLF